LQWRHAEGGALGDACEALVEERDAALVSHLAAVGVRGTATPSDLPRKGSSGSLAEGPLSDLCGPCAARYFLLFFKKTQLSDFFINVPWMSLIDCGFCQLIKPLLPRSFAAPKKRKEAQ
jgi:hypothetical protein